MDTLTFSFDELPLCIAPGIEAALINGSAEISYSRDGQWEIKTIYVEGYRAKETGGYERISVLPSNALEAIIRGRLGYEWRQKIVDAVRERLAGDYEERAA